MKDIDWPEPVNWWRYPDKPISATPAVLDRLERSGLYFAQCKYDGWRAVCEIVQRGGDVRVRLFSHSKLEHPASHWLREAIARASAWPEGTTVLDGEWMGRRGAYGEAYAAFDAWCFGGDDLTELPAAQRAAWVHGAMDTSEAVFALANHWNGFRRLFEHSRRVAHLEGIVLKRADSVLKPSPRGTQKTSDWIKVKYRNVDGTAALGAEAQRPRRAVKVKGR